MFNKANIILLIEKMKKLDTASGLSSPASCFHPPKKVYNSCQSNREIKNKSWFPHSILQLRYQIGWDLCSN